MLLEDLVKKNREDLAYLVCDLKDFSEDAQKTLLKVMEERGIDSLQASDGAVFQLSSGGHFYLGFLKNKGEF